VTEEKPKMTEAEYCAGEFTDAEVNCQADIADCRRAVEEFFLEHQHQMDEQTRERFGGILRSHDRRHSILRAMRTGV
jgi:hypothetical protein